MQILKHKTLARLLTLGAFLIATQAFAGVHDLASFLETGKWSVGFEPEITISSPAGAGINIKPKYGFNELINWQAIIGTGTDHRFKLGFTADFDWFPDVDKQPGIATPITILQSFTSPYNVLSVFASPMIYKTFDGQKALYTPFVSIPMGWNISNSNAKNFFQFVMGSMFKAAELEQFKFTIEAGFNLFNSYSYISGGATYFH